MSNRKYPAVIIFNEKHVNFPYIVHSLDGEKKCMLDVLIRRKKQGWFDHKKWIEEDVVKLTEQLSLLKSVTPTVQLITEEIKRVEERLKYLKKDLLEFENIDKAIEEKNYNLAYKIMWERTEHEYENFNIEYDVDQYN